MKRYVGLDVHKQTIEACILNDAGQVEARHQVACEQTAITEFARTRLRREDQVVLEATTNTWRVVELLRPHVGRVVVGNPLKTRAIAEAKIKTDKLDAAILAQLLRCDYLPAVWEPDAATQELRQLTGHRANLINDRSRLKNRINSLLAQRLIKPPVSILFTKSGLAWLKALELATDDRLLIDGQLRLVDQLETELKLLDQRLAKLAHDEEQARLLMTLPGFGYPVALTVLGALGDLSRFRDGDHAASYLGLTPSTSQSAGRCYHGRITKTGNRQARWMLTQAAQQAVHQAGPLGVFFRRLCRRKNRNVAIVATARKLVTIAFTMLKNHEPYRYAMPAPTQQKLSELRVRATGERRPTHSQEPLPKIRRPLDPGIKAKKVRPLHEIYEREGLPACKTVETLPPGERRMLRKTGTLAHAKKVHRHSFVTYRDHKQGSELSSQPAKAADHSKSSVLRKPKTFF